LVRISVAPKSNNVDHKKASVPSYTWKQVQEDGKLFVIDGKVYDIHEFTESHPGGVVITTYLGKDATGTLDEL
jgi:cytochrome b involved in lipid metabolism